MTDQNSAEIVFPRQIQIMASGCVAVLRKKDGTPLLSKYPSVEYLGETWKGHRLSYCLNVEKIPRCPASSQAGLVLHTCDNKWCIEPSHIYLGSNAENIRSAYERHPTLRQSRVGNQNSRGHTCVMSEEAKRQISETLKGNKNGLGHRHTDEARQRMSASQQRRALEAKSRAQS